jgi:glycosyltransferase involved in cell wall biosynthesis
MSDQRQIAIDLQPIQGYSSRHRGIGRYVLELVTAIVDDHPEHVHSLLVNAHRPVPPELERFLGTGLVRAHSQSAPEVDGAAPDIYFVTSPFEFDLNLDEIWPKWAREPSVDTVVTLYDLIPTLFPDEYLSDPIWPGKHWARLEFVKQAGLLLCISQATADDALEHLGLDPRRVTNIGTGVSDHFFQADDDSVAMAKASDLMDGLRPKYLMYTGGIDYRKNISGLLEAYALLPPTMRADHQLVIVCRVLPTEREALMAQARALGIAKDILITGFVPDTTLSSLYQAAHLFVFPSIYEGFGLPVAEAILSGTLAIASDSSSMKELVLDPELRFDPLDSADIARCIADTLSISDAEERRRSQFKLISEEFHWKGVASRAVESMTRTKSLPSLRPVSRRPRIALVTPLPPARSGIADYSWRLAHALAAYVEVDLVHEGSKAGPIPESPYIGLVSPYGLLTRDSILAYDEVVYVMGNSSHHAVAYELMSQRKGSVMIHEARFTGFFEWYTREHGEAHDSAWFQGLLREEYQGVEPSLGRHDWLSNSDAAREGLYLTGPLVDMAHRVLTTSAFTAELTRLQRPGRRDDIVDIGFGYPRLEPSDRHEGLRWISTFGYQNEIKAADIIIEAFATVADEQPHLKLAVVGEVAREFAPVIEGLIEDHGLAGRVVMTSRVESDEYEAWLRRTDIAIQIRRITNGEVSAAVGDCLSYGIPTIVTAVGPAAELPDSVVRKTPSGFNTSDIASSIRDLMSDPSARSELGANARGYVSRHSFDATAVRFLDAIGLPAVPRAT